MVIYTSSFGAPGLIAIGVVALLIFGPKKLPELGRAMGSTLREFRSATKGLTEDEDDVKNKNIIEHKENNSETKQP